MTKDTVEPAFPSEHFLGMTLRDYFAGKALEGSLAAHAGPDISLPNESYAANIAYAYADAMIEERNKK